MWRIISIFTSLLFLSFATYAINDELEIQLVNNNKIELKPGSNSNLVVLLINNSDSDKEFLIKIQTPKGLNTLSDYSTIIVERKSKRLKIFSFYINESAKVGDYTIDIEAYNKLENSKIGIIKIPVIIIPKYDILAKVLNPPDYLFSGDTLTVKFMLQNLSNTKVNIEATIINAKVIETKKITLNPDSSMIFNVFITTNEDITQHIRKSVSLNALIVESPETKSQASYIFDVIPSEKIKFDSYNRIPTRISGLFVTNNQTGERLYGYMFDVAGAGNISRKRNSVIAFHFRGPNRQGNPILGQTDEYNIKYFSIRSRVALGDNSYSLTNLTEGARSGRGGEYEHKLNKLSFGTFINYPRFYPDIQRVASVYGSYFNEEKLKLKIGYLNKLYITDSSAQLATISGEVLPFSWSKIKFEFATGMAGGETTMAYSADLDINYSKYRLFFSYKKAGYNFPGYMTNSQYLNSGITTSFGKININLSYNLNHTNIALDTMFSNAPYSSSLSFSTGYSFSFNHSIGLSANMRSNEDMSMPKQFNYKEYTGRISLRSRFNRFGINAYGAYGKTENFLPLKVGEVTNVLNANLTMQYNINKNIFTKCFISYSGGQQYLQNDMTKFFYGVIVDAKWGSKMKILFQYQNNYEVEEYYKDRSLLGLRTLYLLHPNHQIGASVNYDLRKNSLNNTVLSASLNYTYTINIPISRRDDVGSLKGKVINNGVNNIEGILFTLAGNIVFTDKNGEFEIPFVKKGTYFLFMDNSASELNTIAETRGPYKIDILPSEETYFEVSLTKSSKIIGSIVIQIDKNENKKGYIPIKETVKKLIIEVNNGKETYRLYTNNDGTFVFNDLRPGKWKMIVYKVGIPDGYQLLSNKYDLTLSSEEVKEVNVILKKKSRKIKFQKR
ncbi:MAG: prealbumin-like fold domain-containing protein [Candidatus Marithrix sp.]